MDLTALRRLTAAAAVLAAICLLIQVPLYFVYEGAPPAGNILTRCLFGLIGFTAMVVFLTGFGHLAKRRAPELDWVASLAMNAGLLWLAVLFVGQGLEVGAVIQSPTPIDPTVTVSGTYILYGTIARLLEALFLFAFGFAVRRTHLLPDWAGFTAYLLALINLAFVPSLFFGNDPADFYAANGWGTTATMGGITFLWILIVGVTLLRAHETGPVPTGTGPVRMKTEKP